MGPGQAELADARGGRSPAERQRAWGLAAPGAWLAVVLAVLLGETLFGGKVLAQIDALVAFPPWSSEAPDGYRPANALLLDQSTVVLPLLHFFGERVADGELPLWNPHNYAGHPSAAGPTGALFWPPHWIYLAWPSWHFFAWHAFARLLAAGGFTLLFLRAIGVGRGGAALGALSYALCGFLVAWLNHPHANVAPLLPLFLYLVERAVARPGPRTCAAFAAATALAWVGGHVQTALHVGLAVAAYAGFRAAVRVDGARLAARGVAALGCGAALGLGLASPQLLPLAEYLAVSQGAVVSDAVDLVDAPDPRQALWFYVDPHHYGAPHTHDYTGPTGSHLNYQELVGGWVGRLALVLAAVQVVLGRRNRRSLFFAGAVVLAALVAYQVGPLYDLLREVPTLRSTKLTRFVLFVAFGLAVLAAQGLDTLLARLRAGARTKRALAAAAFLVAAAELVHAGRGYNPALDADSPVFLPETEVTRFLRADASLHRVLGVRGTTFAPNANLFYGVDLLTGYDGIEHRTTAQLVALLTTDPAAEYYVREIRYFDRLVPLASLLNVKYVLSDAPLPPPLELVLEGPLEVYANPHVLPRAFVAHRVELEPSPERRLERLGAEDFDPFTALVERLPEEASLRAALDDDAPEPPGRVEVASYEPRRVRLVATMERPGLVVLGDAWDAGWSATADGEPVDVERVDHGLRGVWVGAGETELELAYAPASMRRGLALAALAGVATLLCALRRGRGAAPAGPAAAEPRGRAGIVPN